MGNPQVVTAGAGGAVEPRTIFYVRARSWFMGAALAMVAVFAITLLNAGLAGGRFGLLDDTKWDEVVPWPFIPIPAWVVIAIGAVAPIAMIVILRWVTREQFGDVVSLGLIAIVVFVVLPLIFSTLYTMPGGTIMNADYPEYGQGLHWIAAPIQVITAAALVIRGIRFRMTAPAKDAS